MERTRFKLNIFLRFCNRCIQKLPTWNRLLSVGGLSYGSNRAGIGADRVAPLDMEGGTSESSIAIVSLDQQRVDAPSPAKQVGLLSKVFVHFIARGREWLKLT